MAITPIGLGERGLALFEELSTGSVAHDSQVLEAARIADRLDELDNIIQGKGVLELMQFRLDFPEGDGEPFTVEVKFQNVLAEARQQATAFATVLQKIGTPEQAKKLAPVPEPVSSQISNISPLAKMQGRAKKAKGVA